MTIYTLGYSGWKIEDVEAVLERFAAILVDVRMVPRTRRPSSPEYVAHTHGGAMSRTQGRLSSPPNITSS